MFTDPLFPSSEGERERERVKENPESSYEKSEKVCPSRLMYRSKRRFCSLFLLSKLICPFGLFPFLRCVSFQLSRGARAASLQRPPSRRAAISSRQTQTGLRSQLKCKKADELYSKQHIFLARAYVNLRQRPKRARIHAIPHR